VIAGGLQLCVRPLRHGEARTVMSVFARLSERSRRTRFNGAKPCLGRSELRKLATVDADRRALVAFVEGDPEPVAIARLVRNGERAEVAFAVADDYQRRGIGSALVSQLLAEARADGVREITGLVGRDNSAAVALLRRTVERLHVAFDGPDLSIRAAL
jgi:acetyltransferase